jgi:hypothetical protein
MQLHAVIAIEREYRNSPRRHERTDQSRTTCEMTAARVPCSSWTVRSTVQRRTWGRSRVPLSSRRRDCPTCRGRSVQNERPRCERSRVSTSCTVPAFGPSSIVSVALHDKGRRLSQRRSACIDSVRLAETELTDCEDWGTAPMEIIIDRTRRIAAENGEPCFAKRLRPVIIAEDDFVARASCC